MTERREAVRALLDQQRPLVMGVLNVTPDSFSDGGAYDEIERAIARAETMVAEGADIIDIGGESTRPGAAPVDTATEMARVVPVIEALAQRSPVVLSVDTSKPAVMQAAVAAGAALINDVRALRAPGALQAAAELEVPVCLMHMQGEPRSMQQSPSYADATVEVVEFLCRRIDACTAAGIARDDILLDPGFGFGKRLEDNLQLVRELEKVRALGQRLLIGVSRKSMVGALTGRDVAQRVTGSVMLAAACVERGANIVRVHDVAPTWDALKTMAAVRGDAWWEARQK